LENRKVKQVLSGGWQQWDGEEIRKGCTRENMMEYYVPVHENGKMRPVEIISGMGEGKIKENGGGGEFTYYIVLELL
jgi:hypothetical protein